MTTPTSPIMPVVSARRSGNVLNVLLVLAALLAVGGIAFAVGRTTAPATTAAAANAANGGAGNFGGNFGPRGSGAPGGGFGGGGRNLGIRGTVTAVSPTSVTIQIAGGATMTVATDGATTYHQQVAGQATDVAAGREVIVQLNGANQNPAGGTPGASPSGRTAIAGDITLVAP